DIAEEDSDSNKESQVRNPNPPDTQAPPSQEPPYYEEQLPPGQAPTPPELSVRPPPPPQVGRNDLQTWHNVARYWDQVERYNQRVSGVASRDEQAGENRVISNALRQEHVARGYDESGRVVPFTDESGNIMYRPGKGPVTYDEQGRATQVQYSQQGPSKVLLDQNAPIGPHPDYPGQLFKQNKYAPWA